MQIASMQELKDWWRGGWVVRSRMVFLLVLGLPALLIAAIGLPLGALARLLARGCEYAEAGSERWVRAWMTVAGWPRIMLPAAFYQPIESWFTQLDREETERWRRSFRRAPQADEVSP